MKSIVGVEGRSVGRSIFCANRLMVGACFLFAVSVATSGNATPLPFNELLLMEVRSSVFVS